MEGPYALDLTRVYNTLRVAWPTWTESVCYRAVGEVLAYIGMVQRAQLDSNPLLIVPSRVLYEVVDTIGYCWRELCGTHYVPQPVLDVFDADGYEQTYALYEGVYGRKPPVEFWPKPVNRRLVFESLGAHLRE